MPADNPQESSLYDLLQVRADASSRDITRAYRRLARASHPDARPADVGAAARFQALSDAYELLSDPARRAAYDARRHRPPAGPPRPGVSEPAARGPSVPSPPPLWPLGPAATAPLTSRPRGAPAGPAVQAGPVRVEPLPGDSAAGQASAEARLLLAELVRAFLGDDRNRPW